MKYLSLCSGIEAATVAWHSLGFKPVGFSEIEKFPCEVLKHHYSSVPNFGDMTKFKEWKNDLTFDILIGGTPCQSFSVAGLREGLKDPRGNLMLTYGAIAKKYRPKWLVWENVPGVLTSNNGNDFKAFLQSLAECGYGFAYRVLDAQFFGVPQRRKRVFVVGCLGDWQSAAKVLFDQESLSRNIKPSRKKRKDSTSNSEECSSGSNERKGNFEKDKESKTVGFRESSFGQYEKDTLSSTLKASGGVLAGGSETFICQELNTQKVYENHPTDSRIKEVDVAPTLSARYGTGGNNVPLVQGFNTNARPDEMKLLDNQSNTLTASQTVGVVTYELDHLMMQNNIKDKENGEPCNTLGASSATKMIVHKKETGVTYDLAQVTSRYNAQNREDGDPCFTLAKGNAHTAAYVSRSVIRKLTPKECERLQGFPDNYTQIPYGKKSADQCPDGPRYKALGNSMAVPVIKWIGERIKKYN